MNMDKARLKSEIEQKLKALKSSFIIQAGHPKAQYLKENEFEELKEVFPKLFSEDAERAILIWNKIPVLFSYTFACYSNFDNLIQWFLQMLNHEKGDYEFTLMTDDFMTDIKAYWKEDVLLIKSDWLEKKSHSTLAEILNNKNTLRINLMDFLKEWKIILIQIEKAFKAAGVKITNQKEKEKFLNIYKIINKIEGQGKRYTV